MYEKKICEEHLSLDNSMNFEISSKFISVIPKLSSITIIYFLTLTSIVYMFFIKVVHYKSCIVADVFAREISVRRIERKPLVKQCNFTAVLCLSCIAITTLGRARLYRIIGYSSVRWNSTVYPLIIIVAMLIREIEWPFYSREAEAIAWFRRLFTIAAFRLYAALN